MNFSHAAALCEKQRNIQRAADHKQSKIPWTNTPLRATRVKTLGGSCHECSVWTNWIWAVINSVLYVLSVLWCCFELWAAFRPCLHTVSFFPHPPHLKSLGEKRLSFLFLAFVFLYFLSTRYITCLHPFSPEFDKQQRHLCISLTLIQRHLVRAQQPKDISVLTWFSYESMASLEADVCVRSDKHAAVPRCLHAQMSVWHLLKTKQKKPCAVMLLWRVYRFTFD